MKVQKYSKKIFVKNVEILLKFNWEPEIEIITIDGQKKIFVGYKNFIDIIDENGGCLRVDDIRQATKSLKWRQIKSIRESNGVDFSVSIKRQSVVVDGVLWINNIARHR